MGQRGDERVKRQTGRCYGNFIEEKFEKFELDNRKGVDYRDMASVGGILFYISIISSRAEVVSIDLAHAESAREIG
ncbi:MAG: hypothetical protein A2Z08_00320 [Deltaproteobacteria bacterium RBG_16_54_11]|jgi:hypothetical protein|nr:MAG: hypothetical protein A2Z08_00320 [Deltaproteobacteria bacterium RBG_16_54_11]